MGPPCNQSKLVIFQHQVHWIDLCLSLCFRQSFGIAVFNQGIFNNVWRHFGHHDLRGMLLSLVGRGQRSVNHRTMHKTDSHKKMYPAPRREVRERGGEGMRYPGKIWEAPSLSFAEYTVVMYSGKGDCYQTAFPLSPLGSYLIYGSFRRAVSLKTLLTGWWKERHGFLRCHHVDPMLSLFLCCCWHVWHLFFLKPHDIF